MFFKCCMCRVNSKKDSIYDDIDSDNNSTTNVDYLSKLDNKTVDDSIEEEYIFFDTLSDDYYYWALAYLFSKEICSNNNISANCSSMINTGFNINL